MSETDRDQLKDLISSRGVIKGKLTRHANYFAEKCVDHEQIEELESRLGKIEDIFSEFEEVQSKIESVDSTQNHDKERDEFEENYFKLCGKIKKFINQNTNTNRVQHNSTSSSCSHNTEAPIPVRLPTINLPKFTGKYEDWLPFYDSFSALIHNNSALNEVQKLHYLRAALEGEAANTISNLELIASNYDIAISLLKEQFQNTRLIVQQHVRSLFELPQVPKDNPENLRQFLNNCLTHIRALRTLKQEVDSWDSILIHLVLTKLDSTTHKEWELTTEPNELPTFKSLTDFLQKRCQILENVVNKTTNRNNNITHQKQQAPHFNSKFNAQSHYKNRVNYNSKTHLAVQDSKQNSKCAICDGAHAAYQCTQLIDSSHEDRLKKLSAARLCVNCLKPGHRPGQCQWRGCKHCGKKHNTALHYFPSDPRLKALLPHTQNKTSEENPTVTASASLTNNGTGILLSTALVNIVGPTGIKLTCRAFLDNGSQSCFITESLVQQLKLRKHNTSMTVSGITESSTKVNSFVHATIQSKASNYETNASFLVVPKITGLLPTTRISTSGWQLPKNINLADPTFSVPARIDILLGQEYFLEILEEGRIKGVNMPVVQNTALGWIIGGRVIASTVNNTTTCNLNITARLEQNLERFWRIEEPIPKNPLMTKEDKLCDKLYEETVCRGEDGRFTVTMPIKNDITNLGESHKMANRRFHLIERRLAANPELREHYNEFMTTYKALGHMEPISTTADSTKPMFYLPHHPVLKESSTTTKVRVVFDASAKTSSGTSLNDNLMVGPTLQDDLFSILLRFRSHPYVITADIEKMYRQVWVDPNQRDLLRILWRHHESQPLTTYALKTVTYGTACASYLAVKTLQTLAKQEMPKYPEAAKVTMKDFYVDDLLTGATSLEETKALRDQLIQLLNSGGFNLRQWNSNNTQLLEDLPEHMVKIKPKQFPSDANHSKALGISWDSSHDVIKFIHTSTKENSQPTKRTILSSIAKLFDPMGLISPIVIGAKLIMQDLWKIQQNWDDPVPDEIRAKWDEFELNLNSFDKITIQRCVVTPQGGGKLELHAFCDSSEKAYGGAVYVRHVHSDGTATVTLLCAKSRVAPLKTVSLPRLELCGALLLTELVSHVKQALSQQNFCTFYWTDSTIVLAWLSEEAAKWKTFVANRVAKIQETSRTEDWRHVRSEENPADLVSRGTSTENLINSKLWWCGPEFLAQEETTWPTNKKNQISEIPERKNTSTITAVVQTSNDDPIKQTIEKFSSLTKLQRTTAYVLRFINNCKHQNLRLIGPLSPEELKISINKLIIHEQNQHFTQEVTLLSAGKQVHRKSKLLTLHPFKDKEGLIRVGGRLENATISREQKNPIILPQGSRLTDLIVRMYHNKHLHCGAQTLVYQLRQQYWPLNAKNSAKKVIHQCVKCFKAKPRGLQPEMGILPAHRVNESRSFMVTGVDYCGPINIKSTRARRYTLVKSYIAVFVCFSTKAIHLELVSDLTTEAFLAAFKRFVSRRGLPQHVYSDNGTCFVGANNEMKEQYKLLQNPDHQEKIINSTAIHQVKWHFIPARSPHFGGLWEAGVKSVKQHLRRVVGTANLTYEELYTILTMIEACLNSRPLTPLSSDPKDPLPLTPGHFLIGQALTSLPEPDFAATPSNRLSQWQRCQQLMQHFWSRWSREYLSQLQQRPKWTSPAADLQPGQVVLVKEDKLPPLKWITAVVEEVHPGADGKTRVATVRTSTGLYKRAVNRLCALPLQT